MYSIPIYSNANKLALNVKALFSSFVVSYCAINSLQSRMNFSNNIL